MFLYVVIKSGCRIHNAMMQINFQVIKISRLISLTTENMSTFQNPKGKEFRKAFGQVM